MTLDPPSFFLGAAFGLTLGAAVTAVALRMTFEGYYRELLASSKQFADDLAVLYEGHSRLLLDHAQQLAVDLSKIERKA